MTHFSFPRFPFFGLSLLVVFLFTQCEPKKAPQQNAEFTNYISAYTGGVVSNQAVVKIRLTEDNVLAKSQKTINQKLFSFSPDIKGETYWDDAQTIVFKPTESLAPGQLYSAKFYLSELVDTPAKLKIFPFEFQVMKQAMDVEFEGMEAYASKNPEWQKVNGRILTYDYANATKLEAAVKAIQAGEKKTIRWEHQSGGKIHRFIIDSVHRGESRGELLLKWNAKDLGFDAQGEKPFVVPPLGEFKVLDVRVAEQPEQFVSIYFSDPINSKQDLEGLFYFQPAIRFRMVNEGALVKLYPVSHQSRSLKLVVSDAVRNTMGYQLMEKFERQLTFSGIKPAVELIGDGVILPQTNGLLFPFKAVNLSAVNVKVVKIFENNIQQFFQVNQFDGTSQMKRVGRLVYQGEVDLKSDKPIDYGSWNNFSIDLANLIMPEPGTIYRVALSFSQKQSLYPCSEKEKNYTSDSYTDTQKTDDSWDAPSDYWYYSDGDEDYYYNPDYNYSERNDPCKPSYYLRNDRIAAKNILASDLGIIAKSGNSNNLLVAVTDLKTTEPLANVQIDIYNFQQQLMESGTTDAQGMLTIDLNRKPFLLIAKKDKQRGYLRLDDGNALSMSMFDVGGASLPDGVNGYIYGERGVWRPGDSLFVSFVLNDKNKILPKNHPVVFELYTPQQQLFERKVSTKSVNGFYDFRTATPADAPTGNWRAKIKVGGSEFTKTLKIEAVKPNRLKINLDFDTPVLMANKKVKGDLEVKWLHGAIASNLKVDVELNLSKGNTAFEKFKDFSFDDPSKVFRTEEKMLFEGKVDENGKAEITPDFQVQEGAPGMLRAAFKIRAFEKGGEFSVDRFSIPYSPYTSYVGLKIPEGKGWNGALYSDKPQMIPIRTLDENGNPISRKGVKIEVYDVYWRWWWERSGEDDLARYVANRHQNLVQTASIDTKDGEALFELNLKGKKYGRKFIRLIDPVSGHSAGTTFYVTYSGWDSDNSGENPGGAEMLSFTTDKKSYRPGEKIKVSIPAARQGKLLVSFETASKILNTFWLDLAEGKQQFEVEATADMAPNVYINLSLIQPHNNVKNDLPIRLYGVQSVRIEDPETHLNPQLTMADELAPEETFTVEVSEASGREMTYTLAVVDDGLLDLTRFKTPNPWGAFYAKEALSIRTWDMYKYVIGAFSGKMAGLLALGGDENALQKGGAKANRFKPVVKFLGPYYLPANQKAKHAIQMPNYVGSVRTMLVAGSGSAYGSAEKTTPVKKPLMVLATLPRVLGPGEEVLLPVTVFAMDDKISEVQVEVEPNEMLQLQEAKTKTVHFNRQGDKVINFRLKTAEKIGLAKIKIRVKDATNTAFYEMELDVRSPNPRVTDVVKTILEPGQSWETKYKPIGISGTNTGTVELSTIPPLKLEERLQYLMQYPHGCIEQTVSAVFPQLYLANLLQLTADQKMETEENIKAGINKLRSFQIYSGGFSYWPGNTKTANDWGSSYAGHFLLEAKAKGYSLPPSILSNWIQFQKQRAENWLPDSDRYSLATNQLMQAYRLYTLALAGEPSLGAMNRMRNLSSLSVAARWRLAAAYKLIGKKSVAENLIYNLSSAIEPYTRMSYTYGSALRDKAMILETLNLLGKKQEAKIILDELAEAMASGRWLSTQTTAYALLAVAQFVGNNGDFDVPMSYTYSISGQKENKQQTEAPISQFALAMNKISDEKLVLKNTGKQTLFVEMQLQGIPANGLETDAQNELEMRVRYLNLDGAEINPALLQQGMDFKVEVQLRHPGLRDDYRDLALTQIFPSGWEIRNWRMDETSNPDIKNNTADYQDIRDDRVLTYFGLRRGETKTFSILLNASYVGKFYLPAVSCEAMYNHTINARKAGKWVEVVASGQK